MDSYEDQFSALEAATRTALEELTTHVLELVAAATRRWAPAATHVGLVCVEGNCELMEVVTPAGSYQSDTALVETVRTHTRPWLRWLAVHLPERFHDNAIPVGLYGDLWVLPGTVAQAAAADAARRRLWRVEQGADLPFEETVTFDRSTDPHVDDWQELWLTDTANAGADEVDAEALQALSAGGFSPERTSSTVGL